MMIIPGATEGGSSLVVGGNVWGEISSYRCHESHLIAWVVVALLPRVHAQGVM